MSYKDFINEKAVPFSDIIDPVTQQGIVHTEQKGSKIHAKIALYDFDDNKILGYIYMAKFKNDDFYEIQNSVAEKNYGPDIYDIALMYAYPNGVKPDTMIKPEALSIWSHYLNNRPDVTSKELDKNDPSYEPRYEPDNESGYVENPEAVKIINTVFYKKPDDNYEILGSRGDEYISKYGIDKIEIMKDAAELFRSKYYK